jgi:hypothetical protein
LSAIQLPLLPSMEARDKSHKSGDWRDGYIAGSHQGTQSQGEQAMSKEHVEVHEGSGNIFADLGLPDAETHYLKA